MADEYRIVCAHYPASGHRSHQHAKATLAKALQAVVDANHHAEMQRDRQGERRTWYVNEAPWRVQVREVGDWLDHQPELPLDGAT